MGIDRRGLWIDDKATGTKFRLGEVGGNLAQAFAEQGNIRLAEKAWSKPHFGFWLSKEF